MTAGEKSTAPSTALIEPARARPAELARLLGVSRQAVHDLSRRGVISMDEDGRIDVVAARNAILNSINPNSKTAVAAAMAVGKLGKSLPAVSAEAKMQGIGSVADTSSSPEAETSYHAAKTMREAAEAQIAALKLAEMRNDLIRVESVKGVMASIFSTVRDAVLQIPARIAPLLAAESDPAVVQNMVHAELHAALESLANAPDIIDKVADAGRGSASAPESR